MSAPDPDRAPIFVVGTGRSGTTLLRLMLNAHPRIYLTHEASFYVTLRMARRRATTSEWLERYFQTFPFGWLRLDSDVVRAALPRGELSRAELPRAFAAVMRCKARHYDRPRYGDKTPFHVGALRQIFRDFEDPRIIHIARDPRATVDSLRRMPWGMSTYGLASWYCAFDAQLARRQRRRICRVRLEDLIGDPASTMRQILDFVGEPWDDRVLDHVQHAPLDDVPPFPWLAGAKRPRRATETVADAAAAPRWRADLPAAWIRNIERQNRRGMREFGYAPARLECEPPRLAQIGAGLAEIPEGLRFVRRLLRVQRTMRRPKMPDAAVSQQLFLELNPEAWRHYPGVKIPAPPNSAGAATDAGCRSE